MKRLILLLISTLLLLPLSACSVNWTGENPVFREDRNELPTFSMFTDGRSMYEVDWSDFFLPIDYEDASLPATVNRELAGCRLELEYERSILQPGNVRVHMYGSKDHTVLINAEDGRIVSGTGLSYPEEIQTQEEHLAHAKKLCSGAVDFSDFSLKIETVIKTADGKERTEEGFYSCGSDEELVRRDFSFRRENGSILVEELWFRFDKKYGVKFQISGKTCEKTDEARLLADPDLGAVLIRDVDAFLREGGIGESRKINRIEYPTIRAFRYGEKLYARVETDMYFSDGEDSEYLFGHKAYVIVALEDYLK